MNTTPPQWDRPAERPAERVSTSETLRALGFTLVYLAFAPPIAVILWRLATGAWS